MIYTSLKQAISDKANIPETELKQLKVYGLGNDGVFASADKIYKVVIPSKEARVVRRLIGKNFINVVKIYNVYEFTIKAETDIKSWSGYIIEQEKLFRGRKDKHFSDFTLNYILNDLNRVPELLSILNGIKELDSVGIKHNDLHSLNLMKDKNNNLKIIDFSIVSLKRM